MGRVAGRSATWVVDNGNGTFTNALFFDEFSGPDLIRVGSDFYLTGTTYSFLPSSRGKRMPRNLTIAPISIEIYEFAKQ